MPRSGEQRGLRVATVAQCLCAAWKELPQSFILAAYIACGWLTVDEAIAELDRMGVQHVTAQRLRKAQLFHFPSIAQLLLSTLKILFQI